MNLNFKEIRSHEGSQDRGFEELCFQMIPVIETLPEGTRLVRHGTPDGGVEILGLLPDGNVWAWQAKFLFTLGPSELAQLDKSFRAALNSQPALKRYVFCLPYNRPAGKVKGRKSAMDRWNEHCIKWQSWATSKNMTVEFGYIGESELLNALTLAGQSGRASFWFNVTVLGHDWFETHVKNAIDSAGKRYTPDLNVELPIAKVFEGLGRTEVFQTQLRLALRAVRDSRKWYALDDVLRKTEYVSDSDVTECRQALDSMEKRVLSVNIPDDRLIDFDAIATDCGVAIRRLEALSNMLYDCAREAEESEPDEQGNSTFTTRQLHVALESASYELRKTAANVRELAELVGSDAALLVNVPALLIIGEAGKGKTHLFCDVASSRIESGQPTVLVFGQRFAPGEPWSQIVQQLDLHCSVDEFLGALNTAAEASNTKVIIFIDAINEGYGVDIWQAHLPAFLNRVRKWPRVGVALSCRTSYVDWVVPEELDYTKLVRVTHEGFVGNEYVAVRTFFEHHKLTLPDFPLLVPEFQTPLLLRVMCEGLTEKGLTALPRGSSGLSSLFNLFLEAIESRLYKPDRCDYPQTDRLVFRAVDLLADNMVGQGREWVAFDTAEELMGRLAPNRTWSKSLLYGLLSEGVLMQSRLFSNDNGKKEMDAVFFTYQRLGDYLRARTICERNKDMSNLRVLCKQMTVDGSSAYRHSGLIEALSILLPERLGREFHEFASDASLEPVQQGYLESLVWRDVRSFPCPLSLDYLNKIARSNYWGNRLVLDTILQVASVPDHPLNSLRLHNTLWRLSMPDRDAWWSRFLYDTYGDESQIDRIVRWAWSSDTEFCADDTVYLCAVTLAWFLTSSHRRLRDHSTKGLVSLLRDRPRILSKLLVKFNGVNDPYVSERLYAVAYGCSLINSDEDAIKVITETVYELVFKDGKPPVQMLLRDYARGVVERAVNMGCLPHEVDLKKCRPPYESPWPITARSEEDLRKRYMSQSHQYAGLWGSLFTLGDFHHYIVEPMVTRFIAGNQQKRLQGLRQEERQRAREASSQANEKWQQFVNSLNANQTKRLLNTLRGKGDKERFFRSLSQEQDRLLHEWIRLGSIRTISTERPIPFSPDLACRWIFSRVISLGWTPNRFADFDSMIGSYRGRRAPQAERVGKKFQWIALHELLARLADHLPLLPDWGESDQQPYDGPWQLRMSRGDIDPSLLLHSSKRIVWGSIPKCWWAPDAPIIPDPATPLNRIAWLSTEKNLPSPISFIKVQDNKGTDWLTLEGHYAWEESVPPELDRWEVERCALWYQIRSYLVKEEDLEVFLKWSEGLSWMGRWMPESYSFYDAFIGEYPWHPASQEQKRGWEQPDDSVRSTPVPMLVTTAEYIRGDSGADCSIENTVVGIVPSPYLVERLAIRWAGEAFVYVNNKGEYIAWDPSATESGPPTLLVDLQSMQKMLNDEGLALVWTILGEKNIYTPQLREIDYSGHLEASGVAILRNSKIELHGMTCKFHSPSPG